MPTLLLSLAENRIIGVFCEWISHAKLTYRYTSNLLYYDVVYYHDDLKGFNMIQTSHPKYFIISLVTK